MARLLLALLAVLPAVAVAFGPDKPTYISNVECEGANATARSNMTKVVSFDAPARPRATPSTLFACCVFGVLAPLATLSTLATLATLASLAWALTRRPPSPHFAWPVPQRCQRSRETLVLSYEYS